MKRLNDTQGRRGDGKFIFGIVVAVIGTLFLLDAFNVLDAFDYVFNGWALGLIALGVFLGVRNRWSTNAPYILVAVGIFNVIPVFHIHGVSSKELAFPAALIALGLFIAFRRKKNDSLESGRRLELVTNGESMLHIDITMGGRKEIVTSKSFRGGSINAMFGGVEVNLMQADSTVQPMVLDVKVSFGSVELIVPAHWEVINEIRPSMGSVEDHRNARMPDNTADKKTLYLRGSCAFGSVEVKSY